MGRVPQLLNESDLAMQPENDLKALIEGYRTGPFRPDPKIYESITHETDSSFGIDLRKWAGEGAFGPMRSIDSMEQLNAPTPRDLPPVLTGALKALKRAYGKLPSDDGWLPTLLSVKSRTN